jgi:hypothetical protein
MVTTGDSGTVTNTMLASSAYTAPGTIGSGTPNTGSFTNLTASGNVGIGTSTPGSILEVKGVSPAILVNGTSSTLFRGVSIRSNGTEIATMFAEPNSGENRITAGFGGFGGFQTFYTNGSERMRIDSSGNLLVGSTSSTFTMPSTGGASFKSSSTGGGVPIVEIGNTDTTTSSDGSPALICFKGSVTTNSNARFIQFSANGASTTMGAIVGAGSGVCAFANFSDVSLKKNIEPLSGSLAKITALNPASYEMISDGCHVNAGFIAQDVQKVYPEYVIENMSNEGEKPLMAITGGMSGGFIAELVCAIKEQQTLINNLTTRLTALESK